LQRIETDVDARDPGVFERARELLELGCVGGKRQVAQTVDGTQVLE
jgi:hypothetical protein